jgi:VanZ family protein
MIKLLIFYIGTVIFLTLNPWIRPDSGTAIGFITWDLVAHASAYGTLSVILILTFIKHGTPLAVTALVILACGFSGIFLEYCQYWFTSTRQLSLYDAIANFTGAILGAMAFWTIRIVAFSTR